MGIKSLKRKDSSIRKTLEKACTSIVLIQAVPIPEADVAAPILILPQVDVALTPLEQNEVIEKKKKKKKKDAIRKWNEVIEKKKKKKKDAIRKWVRRTIGNSSAGALLVCPFEGGRSSSNQVLQGPP
ncbi:hypothetical protein COCNU_scaffold002010G000010 [Cocos nucifera]|nr:hypothetical protein [Cocos nucifera]